MVAPVRVLLQPCAIIEHMAKSRVHLVGRFLARPMQLLSGIMLIVSRYGHFNHGQEGVREIFHQEGPHLKPFASGVIYGQRHRAILTWEADNLDTGTS